MQFWLFVDELFIDNNEKHSCSVMLVNTIKIIYFHSMRTYNRKQNSFDFLVYLSIAFHKQHYPKSVTASVKHIAAVEIQCAMLTKAPLSL